MKLVSISFNAIPRLPGVRPGDLVTIDCDKPKDALRGWRIAIRGQQIFLISPPGWERDQSRARDARGPIAVFEVPRADVALEWQANPEELEALYKGGKYESPPFGPPPTIDPSKPLLAQVPPGQMGDA